MIIVYIILAILLSLLLVAIIVDWVKHPEDYKEPPKRKKRRRRTSDHLPPLTAWTWWMYAEKNSGRFPDSEWRRKYSERERN